MKNSLNGWQLPRIGFWDYIVLLIVGFLLWPILLAFWLEVSEIEDKQRYAEKRRADH